MMLKTNRHRRTRRTGAALVEFAICLPVLVLIVLGSIEATSAVFVRQSLVVAAYEAAREAVRRDGDITEARQRAENVLRLRNVKNATVTITPTNLGSLKRGQDVKVEISTNTRANSPFFGRIVTDRRVSVSTTMVRE